MTNLDAEVKRAEQAVSEAVTSETIPGFFAGGINRYKLFWIFLIVAFAGCVIETVFMLVTRGQLQNRSGVLYGQFSLVWGLGAVLFTLVFCRLERLWGVWIFVIGTVSGAVYEYVCSWLQEMLFGACFWDYSHLPLNINGRVNLVFSLFWGLGAVAWVRLGYPLVCRWIGRLPRRGGKPLTAVLAMLMVANVAVSAAALSRMDHRRQGVPAANAVEVFLDEHYTDRRIQTAFSNLAYIGTDEARAAVGVPKPKDIPGK